MLAKIGNAVDDAAADEPLRLHCFEPWMILKARANQEAKAKKSLMNEGFEVYYGERIRFIRVTIPAKKISSKTRHRRRSEYRMIERPRPIYPGYLFVRRMWGVFDVYRAYELSGVLGLCVIGESVAMVEDYTVESLRLQEARGRFKCEDGDWVELDSFSVSTAPRDIREAHRQENGGKNGKNEARELKRLDEAGNSILFIEELGRITRIITSRLPV